MELLQTLMERGRGSEAPSPRTREIPATDYGCEGFLAYWLNAFVAGALQWTGYWQLRIRRRVNVSVRNIKGAELGKSLCTPSVSTHALRIH